MGSRYSVQNAVKAIDALEGTKKQNVAKADSCNQQFTALVPFRAWIVGMQTSPHTAQCSVPTSMRGAEPKVV